MLMMVDVISRVWPAARKYFENRQDEKPIPCGSLSVELHRKLYGILLLDIAWVATQTLTQIQVAHFVFAL
jgi:hypothetical protein